MHRPYNRTPLDAKKMITIVNVLNEHFFQKNCKVGQKFMLIFRVKKKNPNSRHYKVAQKSCDGILYHVLCCTKYIK